ncbi:protein FMC1 homolog isoform X2 [Brienomyrus brachyistius]|uniref:protein FMC1 homolog isoform X2 n=1 Tax=Brienomyrus brachyistius TaxID=42636 RepID=UPI0020B43B23|nr:protein FMC1 homolog isoform X2 [Brienomyrus brachyistius]
MFENLFKVTYDVMRYKLVTRITARTGMDNTADAKIRGNEIMLVTSERHCRAQREALHASHSYLCLLASTRHHLTLHKLFHGKGERAPEQVARLVGLQLPTQPGGKGWEK